MEFLKERCYTALNADELKVGDKVICANDMGHLKHYVTSNGAVLELKSILDENKSLRFVAGTGKVLFYLAYLVERKENCTNCGKTECAGHSEHEDFKVAVCSNWIPKAEPKTEQKAEKMNERGELDWGMNCCMVCDFYNKDNHRCLVDRDEVLNPVLNTCPHYTPRSPKKCEDCVHHYYENKFDSICRCNMNDRPTTPTQAKTCEYFLREEVEPHYRPFKDTDELIKVWIAKRMITFPDLCMPHIWVRRKEANTKGQLITEFGDGWGVGIGRGEAYNMTDLLVHFTFLDGSVCGVEE